MNINQDRVLVVDDDLDSRCIFEEQLSRLGYSTVTAKDGEDAIDILTQDPYFDLIITDVMMPYMTGFDFTTSLRKHAATKNIPIIATSAFHDWKKAREDHELIADGFVPKPVERDVLEREIKKVMKK